MIVRCPSCASLSELPAPQPGGKGHMSACRSCGHVWRDPNTTGMSMEPIPPAAALRKTAALPDLEVQRLVSAGRQAEEAFLLRRRKKRVAAAGWLALGLFALSPAAIAVAVPERLVTAAPASIGLYQWLGRDVNIYGLEIREVEMQHLLVDGQRVIGIKGSIVNVSAAERKVPWMRFGLRAADGMEVYQWQLDTEQRPLRPGEARRFATRIASPPENAARVEIRFARANEIGSNTTP